MRDSVMLVALLLPVVVAQTGSPAVSSSGSPTASPTVKPTMSPESRITFPIARTPAPTMETSSGNELTDPGYIVLYCFVSFIACVWLLMSLGCHTGSATSRKWNKAIVKDMREMKKLAEKEEAKAAAAELEAANSGDYDDDYDDDSGTPARRPTVRVTGSTSDSSESYIYIPDMTGLPEEQRYPPELPDESPDIPSPTGEEALSDTGDDNTLTAAGGNFATFGDGVGQEQARGKVPEAGKQDAFDTWDSSAPDDGTPRLSIAGVRYPAVASGHSSLV